MFVERLPDGAVDRLRGEDGGTGSGRSRDDRAQAHTLEAFVAALLLVTGLIFATQATAVTPLSASTSNQHIENQASIAAGDALVTARERGDLKRALLYYDDGFVDAHDGDRYTRLPEDPHPIHGVLEEAFDSRRIAFDVTVSYPRAGGGPHKRTVMVDMGEPSDNAATASVLVPLYDGDRLFDPDADDPGDASFSGPRIDDEDAFYAPETAGGSDALYTVVEVRITAWQM